MSGSRCPRCGLTSPAASGPAGAGCPRCGAPRPGQASADPGSTSLLPPAPEGGEAARGREADTLPPVPPAQEGATLPPSPDPLPPLTLSAAAAARTGVPGYEILSELGRGGMGVVYKARQAGLGRTGALKMVLAGGHAGEQDLERFRGEAEAVARLQHPNIVQVFEVGQAGDHPFFSVEFCPGGGLDRKLAGTPLPAGEAAGLAETLAGAVHAAHLAGVVHRDLEPANVLLAADGTPKITDFGLAKRLDDSSGRTRTGSIMGTPSYMAPEQAQGKKDVGPLADVYALGAVLYEMLTGRPPFRAATPLDTVLQVVSDDPAPPRQLNPGVPADLEAVCLRCLEKDPASRYPDAAALAADLARFRDGEPVAARQSGVLGRLAGAVGRVRLREEFAAYGSLLLWLAPLMLLPEVWVTLVVANDWPGHLLGLGQFGRAAGFVLAVGYHRGWRWRPRGAAERQLWAVWGGYLLACFVLGFSGRLAHGFHDTALEPRFYQGLAALTALAFFSLAGSFWGYCAVIGAGFLGLTFLMAADLRWAPLEFGMAWAAVLALLGTRLRRLGAAAGAGHAGE